jgi:hypothetical protein
MGLFTKNKQSPVETDSQGTGLTLSEVEDKYHIVDRVYNPTYGEALIVTEERPRRVRGYRNAMQFAETPSLTEIGSTATRWRRLLGAEEYNTKLQGLDGIETFDKMRRGDASVRSSLRLAKTPVVGAKWSVEPHTRDDPLAVVQAEFIQEALFELMSITWDQVIHEALLMLDFGFYMFEIVYDFAIIDGQPRWIWKKFAPRHPMDVSANGFEYDAHGGPQGVYMNSWEDASGEDFIPIDQLLVFTFDREANNMEGISMIRSAYKHWFIKENLYKIDAIQKERHGIGVPIIKLPPGFTPNDKALAEELGRNLRTNEQAHIVLPPNWDILFAKVEGNPVDAIVSIEHHDQMISKNILAQFLNTGAAASKEQEIDLFMKAVRFIADIIRNVINEHAIKRLVDFNWPGTKKYPKLVARRIGETNDLRTMSFAMRNFIGAGVIVPDDKLEAWTRTEMDAPVKDESTSREVSTPQGATGGTPRPPNVGSPRQSPPSPTPGQDRSGGV